MLIACSSWHFDFPSLFAQFLNLSKMKLLQTSNQQAFLAYRAAREDCARLAALWRASKSPESAHIDGGKGGRGARHGVRAAP